LYIKLNFQNRRPKKLKKAESAQKAKKAGISNFDIVALNYISIPNICVIRNIINHHRENGVQSNGFQYYGTL